MNHMDKRLTAIIEREGEGYVALCVDVASQGDTEARDNLKEALELFFETATEIRSRIEHEVYVTNIEVAVG